jgi:cell division septation protein DedD
MEIATAPAADNNINIDRDTGATTAVMATGKTGPGNGMQVALLPGTDTINRDTASADLPAAGGTLPETAGTNAGLAHTEVPETAAAATAGNADPARFATAPAETTATSEMAATLEQLPPAAAGPATAAADAADPAAETPADTSTPAQGMPPADTPAAGGTIVALAEPAPAAAAPAPATAAAAATAGDWVVNLASYTYQSMARRKLAEFQSKGVNGEIEHVTVNDKPLYRIRVTGFTSSRAARTSISSLEENLGLKGAWISRR